MRGNITKTIFISVYLFVSLTLKAQLNADFSISNGGGCVPLQSSFTNLTTGGSANTVYSWDFGNSNISQLKDPSAVYLAVGTYTVTLIAKDGNQTSTKTKQVNVYNKPEPDFTFSTAKGCLPLTVNFTSTSKPGDGVVTSYFWDFGDGTTLQTNSPSINHVYQTEGNASVSLTVTNQYGCYNTVVKNEIIQVLPMLVADFTVDQTILCRISDEVKFTNTSNGPGTLNYLWNFGDGTTSTEKDPKHIFTQKGIYSIALTVTSSEGCVVTKTLSNHVNVASYKADFSINNAEICLGTPVQITMQSTPYPTQIAWQLGDGNLNYYSSSFSHYYYTKGEYDIKLVNSFGACKDSVTKRVKIKQTPELKGFIDSVVSKCGAPSEVKFRDTTSSAVGWEWTFNYNYYTATVNATTRTPLHNYTTDGTYNVLLKVTNAEGCSATQIKQVSIYKPYVGISAASTSTTGYNYSCGPMTLTFKTNSNDSIVAYKWIVSDQTVYTTPSPSHTFSVPGNYYVRLEYTTAKGCKGEVYYTDIRIDQKSQNNFASESGTKICGNSVVQFRSTESYNTGQYWYINDVYAGSTSYNLFIHQFKDTGRYSIMMITYNGVCADTVRKENYIEVTAPISRIFQVRNTCDGNRNEVQFVDSSKYGTQWTWDFGDGNTITYNTFRPIVSHVYNATGKYRVVQSVTNGTCTVKDSTWAYVLLKQQPLLSVNKSSVCADEPVQIVLDKLANNPYDGVWAGYYFYKIEYGDGTPFYGSNSSYNGFIYPLPYTGTMSNFAPGQTQFRVITSSAYTNCLDTSNYVSLVVNSTKAAFSIDNNNQCYQTPVRFTDQSTVTGTNSITSWEWNFGDGNTQVSAAGGMVTHQYSNPGGYYVTLKVKDISGCTATSTTYTNTSYVQVNGPKAAFSASGTNVPLNTTVNFYNNTNSFNSYNTQYTWDFGNGATSNDYYGSHTYTTAGTYTVKLTATDPVTGCTSHATQVIVVRNFNSAFSFTTSFVGNASCPPVIARFSNTSAGAVRVKWDFGDGSTADNINYPSHIYTKPGTYIVTLFVYGYNGLTGTYIDSVKVKNLTAAITFDPKETCSSQPVNFQASAAGVTNYLWDFGDGKLFSSGDSTTLHSYRGPGVYKPSLLITNSDGCTVAAASTEKVTIDSLSAKISGIPLQACNQVKINFKADVYSVGAAQSQNFLTYKWNFGTGNAVDTSNSANPVFEYTTPGTYTVTLLVTARSGCVKEVKETVVVKESSKVTIAGPAELCAGETATFTSSATITNGVQWNWDFKNGQTATVQNPAAQTYSTGGSYPVTLIVNNQGCLDTAVRVLTVNALPVIQLSPAQPKVCLGNSIQLSAAGGTAYQWSPVVGLSDPQIASPLASPAVTTGYRVLVTNQYGCKKTDSITVKVVQPFSLSAKTDYTICENESVQLMATGAASYKWINNVQGLSTTTAGTVSAKSTVTTTYTVVGYDAENCFTDTININVVVNQRPVVNAGPDVQSLPGNAVQLNASGSVDVTSYMWSPPDFLSCVQCASPVSTTNKTITYIVAVKNDKNCTASDSVTIQVLCNGSQVFIPNSFTPNGDGKNDYFSVLGNGASNLKLFVIYDRWGNKVFERTNMSVDDPRAKWDGNYKGYPAPIGSFTYSIQLTCDATGESFVRNGTITIIR